MYIVHFWNRCAVVGEYLDRMIFDTYADASLFARSHATTAERMRGF